MSLRKKLFLIIPLVLLLGLYWIKCQAHINFIDGFHLGDYLPVGFMVPKDPKPMRTHPGQLLVRESFDAPFWHSDWSELWTLKPWQAAYGLSPGGKRNSKCLVVGSYSVWSMSQPGLVDVKPGEVFSMSALGKVSGPDVTAGLNITLLDVRRKVIQWSFARAPFPHGTILEPVTKTFTIPEGGAFLRFSLSGSGRGQAWFDEVIFQRES